MAAPQAAGGVTGRAISLGVAGYTGVQVAHRLPGVVTGATGARGPSGRRWVEASAGEAIGARTVPCDSDPTVTIAAEGLQLVAAHAAGVVLPSRLRVHG